MPFRVDHRHPHAPKRVAVLTAHALRRGLRRVTIALLAVTCTKPPDAPAALPPNTFAFGVFGDGPYSSLEVPRFRRMLGDVQRSELAWLLHIGDMFGERCDDQRYLDVRDALNELRHAVVFVPGDNDWADCHRASRGAHAPRERLAFLRQQFFPVPHVSLGGARMAVVSQATDTAYREFVEHAQWVFGRIVFATLHIVGGANGQERFATRGRADDDEVERRTAAAIAWMDAAFARAHRDSLRAVVLAFHAQMGFDAADGARRGYDAIVARLLANARAFRGQVLLIHGDSHHHRVDHPFVDPASQQPLAHVTRLETYGSPTIGWVRVLVDSVSGSFRFEGRVSR